MAGNAGAEAHARAMAANPPVIHPVVRTHPETGEDGLFVNYTFTDRIVGLSRKESDAILGVLFDHIQKPEFLVRWRWSENAVAFWDNRVTQHYAVNDYLPARRVMVPATILGDRPYRGSRRLRRLWRRSPPEFPFATPPEAFHVAVVSPFHAAPRRPGQRR